MRIVPLVMLVGTACCTVATWAGDVFGLWNPASWTSPRFSKESFAARFEPHTKGEVFTLDRIDGDGRSTTSSTILYLDSKPRDFQGFGCSGTQSSHRLDSETLEILRTCASGERTRFIRRLSTQPKGLLLEITEQQPGGRRFERHLVLDKEPEAGTTRFQQRRER